VLGRGCYCIWGASFVSWEFVGGLLIFLGSCGFLVVLGFFFIIILVLLGAYLCFFGFLGLFFVFGFSFVFVG
jgi:hypothetical protein